MLQSVKLPRTIAGSKIQSRRNIAQTKVFLSWSYANNPSLLLNIPYTVMHFAWQVHEGFIFDFSPLHLLY